MHKKPFFLMEILVAMALMAIISLLLFRATSHMAKMETRVDLLRKQFLQREYLSMRLRDIFDHVDFQEPLYSPTFQGEMIPSLIGAFTTELDPDPLFSGKKRFRIYLDQSKNLILGISPFENDKVWRQEVLFQGVDQFTFIFFQKKEESGPSRYLWKERFKPEDTDIPFAIRLAIKQGQEKIEFGFSIVSDTIVTY